MKAIVIALLLVVRGSLCETDAFEGPLQASIRECAEENKIDANTADSVWNNPDVSAQTPLKCFYHCMNVKLGIVDENEVIEEETFTQVFKRYGKSTGSIDVVSCKGIQVDAGDLCEAGYQLVKCLSELYLAN